MLVLGTVQPGHILSQVTVAAGAAMTDTPSGLDERPLLPSVFVLSLCLGLSGLHCEQPLCLSFFKIYFIKDVLLA